jgi:hypothetical protein
LAVTADADTSALRASTDCQAVESRTSADSEDLLELFRVAWYQQLKDEPETNIEESQRRA